MGKKVIGYSIGILTILITAIFIGGFLISVAITEGKTIQGRTEPVNSDSNAVAENSKPEEINSNGYNVLIMGDSLAKGTGDEKGLGFTNDYVASLKSKLKKEIKVRNIAVNGDKSENLLQIVENKETSAAIQSAQTIFISIGGNEIKEFKNSELSITSAAVKKSQNSYLEDLKKIIKGIRERNKTSTIVYIGLYNPFDTNITPEKIKLLTNWNYETEQILVEDPNAVFIPTYDLFKYNLSKYLSADNFHPNSMGYEAISKRIAEVLKNF